jgi:hypothetical protein
MTQLKLPEYKLTTDFYAYYCNKTDLLQLIAVAKVKLPPSYHINTVLIRFATNNTPLDHIKFQTFDIINVKVLSYKNIQLYKNSYHQKPSNKDIIYTDKCKRSFIEYNNKYKNNHEKRKPNIVTIDNTTGQKDEWLNYIITDIEGTGIDQVDISLCDTYHDKWTDYINRYLKNNMI